MIAADFKIAPRQRVESKDARIAELEKQIAEMTEERLRTPGAYRIVSVEEDDKKDARIKELESVLHETNVASAKASWQEKRLSCEDGKYDKCGVGGVSVDGAIKAARLAEQMLDHGHELSYAAACLLILHREFRDARAANSTVDEFDRDAMRFADSY